MSAEILEVILLTNQLYNEQHNVEKTKIVNEMMLKDIENLRNDGTEIPEEYVNSYIADCCRYSKQVDDVKRQLALRELAERDYSVIDIINCLQKSLILEIDGFTWVFSPIKKVLFNLLIIKKDSDECIISNGQTSSLYYDKDFIKISLNDLDHGSGIEYINLKKEDRKVFLEFLENVLNTFEENNNKLSMYDEIRF